MSWTGAFRWCGGAMDADDVQVVVRQLSTMGYRAVVGDQHWITNLYTSNDAEVWHAATGREHDEQIQSVRDALVPAACEMMDVFYRRNAIIDDHVIKDLKLHVGTATKLPLPR